jgi:polyisoprenyl-teichoic acid--peptidoglycan teichoic acid transferase
MITAPGTEETTLPKATATPRRTPRWALWCVILGAVLLVAGGGSAIAVRVLLTTATGTVTQQNLLGTVKAGTERRHVTVSGAKNILLIGLDTRPGQDAAQLIRSDSIILLHVTADHSQGYVVSLPRDSYVQIPAYRNGKVPYGGGKNKINAAFAYGSRGLTGASALSHGFELLALTVRQLSGITPDAGAIIDFQGFKKVVDVLGRVCMYVDEDTTSIHYGRDAAGRTAAPYKINPDGTLNRRIAGVQANRYARGDHCFNPSQALDFVRQRDLLANRDYDYGRQRHQQQFLKAVLQQVVDHGLDSPTKLPGLISAVGRTMTVDDGGIPLQDWAFAMRNLNPADLVTVKTNDGRFNSRSVPGVGSVEVISDTSLELLRAVRTDDVAAFALAHPTWISAG